MPILESRFDQFAIQRNLLAASWGTVVGLFFGVPPAFAATGMGLPWLPYGIGVIVAGLIAGLLIAFTIDVLIPRQPVPTDEPRAVAKSSPSNVRSRLAEEKASLDHFDDQRRRRPGYGKAAEDRIVWGELLDLEIQDIDEQVSRICSRGSAEKRRDE